MATNYASATEHLIAGIGQLRTFADVADWDRRAQLEMQQLESILQATDSEIARAQEALAQAQRDFEGKGLLSRVFGGRGDIQRLEASIAASHARKRSLEEAAESLQAHIDFTPNDAFEQKSMLKELKLRKKELQAEKKEATAAMREIRVASRQASANIGPSYGMKLVGTMNAAQRRSIRLQKEAALGPHEDQKSAIERQLLMIDRRILWVERLQ